MRYLLAVDGSENAHRAVDYVIAQAGRYKDGLQVVMVNAQPTFSGGLPLSVNGAQIRKQHKEHGLNALRVARSRFKVAGIAYEFHIGVGDAARVIVKYAREHSCNQIVMGTRGQGAIAGLLFGSVATKVLHLTELPVLLVK